MRGVAAVLGEQVEEDRLDFRIGEPALCPCLAAGEDVPRLRRAGQVAEEAGVVGGCQSLAALGDEADERHVAVPQRILVGMDGFGVVSELLRGFDARPPFGDEAFDGVVEPRKEPERARARLEEGAFVGCAVERHGHAVNAQGVWSVGRTKLRVRSRAEGVRERRGGKGGQVLRVGEAVEPLVGPGLAAVVRVARASLDKEKGLFGERRVVP